VGRKVFGRRRGELVQVQGPGEEKEQKTIQLGPASWQGAGAGAGCRRRPAGDTGRANAT
jgi:hypothetical protein